MPESETGNAGESGRQPSHYEWLGVSTSATGTEIKKAYRKAMMRTHPDKRKDDSFAHEQAVRFNEIKEVLLDPLRRRQYDEQLRLEALRWDGLKRQQEAQAKRTRDEAESARYARSAEETVRMSQGAQEHRARAETINTQTETWERSRKEALNEELSKMRDEGMRTGRRLSVWVNSEQGKETANTDLEVLVKSLKKSRGFFALLSSDRFYQSMATYLRDSLITNGRLSEGGVWGEKASVVLKRVLYQLRTRNQVEGDPEKLLVGFEKRLREQALAERYSRSLADADIPYSLHYEKYRSYLRYDLRVAQVEGFRRGWQELSYSRQ